MYGLGVERLAQSLNISVAQAKTLKHGFHGSFPKLTRCASSPQFQPHTSPFTSPRLLVLPLIYHA